MASIKHIRMRFFILVALAVSLSFTTTSAQDLHFSQFYHNPMHLSPASTGMFRGDMRGAVLYRSQWTSVPVSYQTFAGAFDWKAIRNRTNMVSFGGLLQHDHAGDGVLSWNQIGITGSVAHAIGATQAIAAGFGVAFAQRNFDISGLKFKNQWGGDYFDPSLPSKETMGDRSGMIPTFSVGVNWLYEPGDTRTRIQTGIGLFHLNRPSSGFSGDSESRLPVRLTGHVQLTKQMGEWLDLIAVGALQQMNTAHEIIAGAGVRRILAMTQTGAATAVQFTLSSRLGDALIPAFQLERGSWTFGVSYDWNTSDFEAATNNRGGIELALIYRTLPVPPPKVFKACPIF